MHRRTHLAPPPEPQPELRSPDGGVGKRRAETSPPIPPQCLAGLIRIGKTRADPVLPEPRPKRIGRPRRHGRPQPYPCSHHIEGDSVAFQLQRSVLAAEPGIGGGTGLA
jgi:hypothetical protein